MKKTILTIISMMTAVSLTFGADEALSFDDGDGSANAGTYNNAASNSFSLQITISWTGYLAQGFSLWFKTSGAGGTTLAGFLTITGRAIGADSTQFADPNQTPGFPVSFSDNTEGGDNWKTPDPSDFGYTANSGPVAAGSYHLTTVSFSIAAGAAPGTYTLFTDDTGGHRSIVTEDGFASENGIPATPYTITIVPEPSTFALLGLAAAGLGVVAYRRRTQKA